MNGWRLLKKRWGKLSPREQRMSWLALALVLTAMVWWLAIAPALQVLKAADGRHQILDAQLDRMLEMQARAQVLRALPTLTAQESQRALESSVRTLGDAAQMTQQMDRWVVTLKGATAPSLAGFLAAARQNAHALPVEAHLKRNAGGSWEGTLVFAGAGR